MNFSTQKPTITKLFVVVGFLIFCACNRSEKISLHFLDEYVLRDTVVINEHLVGGLSGIDFSENQLFFPVDDSKTPRVLVADVEMHMDTITSINFNKSIYLRDSVNPFYQNTILDLESIFIDENRNEIHLVSEGSIVNNKHPSIFKMDKTGKFLGSFELPKNLSNISNFKHNSAFEASSKSISGKGFWIAMEAPLKADGEQPTFKKTNSPIRLSYFDYTTNKASKQFAYELESISRKSKGSINLNGVTAILEYQRNHFFIIERIYQNEFGVYGNIVRIYEAFIDDQTTDILQIEALKNTKYIPLKKRLLFDFEDVRSKLTNSIVDNIEGITFGPKLSNGNQSLILVSDDNFQLYGKQLNQFILLEIKTNK